MSIIIPANSATGNNLGYQVANGVRFNSASSESLSRDPSSSGSLIGTNTISFWVKRSTDNTEAFLVYAIYDANYRFKATFLANGKLQLNTIIGGSNNLVYETNRLFRDTSAWYHLVFAFDGRLAVSAGDRCRIYVNGVEETSFSTEENMGSDTSNFMSDKDADVYIGAQATGNFFDGYISEFVFIDEQQLTPTSFGEFNEDSGVWQPLESVADLTFGTNGFYLDFQDSSALGNDVSGNNNDYTANNLAAIDQSTDTCTNNFATANSVGSQRIGGGSIRPTAYSEGNLRVLLGSSEYYTRATSTIAVSTGKWYWETKMISNCDSGSDPTIGIIGTDGNQNAQTGTSPNSSMQYRYTGQKGYNDVGNASYGATWTNGDIIGIALDLTSATKTITFYKNNASQGVAFSGNGTSDGFNPASQYWSPFWVAGGSTNGTMDINFGNPTFTGTDQTDGNSRGSFEYEPPSGFLSLCSLNLSEELS